MVRTARGPSGKPGQPSNLRESNPFGHHMLRIGAETVGQIIDDHQHVEAIHGEKLCHGKTRTFPLRFTWKGSTLIVLMVIATTCCPTEESTLKCLAERRVDLHCGRRCCEDTTYRYKNLAQSLPRQRSGGCKMTLQVHSAGSFGFHVDAAGDANS